MMIIIIIIIILIIIIIIIIIIINPPLGLTPQGSSIHKPLPENAGPWPSKSSQFRLLTNA